MEDAFAYAMQILLARRSRADPLEIIDGQSIRRANDIDHFGAHRLKRKSRSRNVRQRASLIIHLFVMINVIE